MNESEYFRKHLDILFNNCFQGKLHISTWENLDKELKNHRDLFIKYELFWVTTLKSQLESAQLHLIKMFDKRKDTIRIKWLVNYARNHKEKIFKPNDFHLLLSEIKEFEKKIKEYDNYIEKLKRIRDKNFIHLSTKYVSDYEILYEDYVEIRNNIHDILIICGSILRTFRVLAFNETSNMITGKETQTTLLIRNLLK